MMIGSGWANGCVTELISLGWVDCDPDVNLDAPRAQKFTANQRSIEAEEVTRTLTAKNINKMTQSTENARLITKDSTNRKTSVSGKGGKTSFKGKNRTIH